MADLTPNLLIGQISDGSCHGFASMVLVATTLTFGPIILKIVRVWFIFDNPAMKKRQLSNGRLLAYLAAYVLVEVLVGVITGVVAPVNLISYRYRFSDFGEIDRVMCSDEGSGFAFPAYVLAVCPVISGLVVACKTRNVSDRYTESRGIVQALNSLVFAGIVAIPMSYILG